MGSVRETSRPCLLEPLKGPVDGGTVNAEVAGDGLRAPAVHAQLHDRCSAFSGIFHLVVAWVVPRELQGHRLFVEYPPYGADIDIPTEASAGHVGYLVQVEGWILSL